MRHRLGLCAALVFGLLDWSAQAQPAPIRVGPRTARPAAIPPAAAGRVEATADGACRLVVPETVTGTLAWDGACRNGLAEGRGTATWRGPAGATTIAGTFRNGGLTGPGTRVNPDGGRYEGQFVQTVAQGQGVLVAPNGMRYEGPFVAGVASGNARIAFPNGDRFEGGVVNGLGEGPGDYTWANGDRYVGNQTAGYPDGQGRFTTGTQVFEGIWSRGCFVGASGTRIAVVRPMAECR